MRAAETSRQFRQMTPAQVMRVVDMLSPARCHDYDNWSKAAWALRGEGDRFSDAFMTWSAKSDNFDADVAHKVFWVDYKPGKGLSMGTLRMWAMEDSPQEYAEYFHPPAIQDYAFVETSDDEEEAAADARSAAMELAIEAAFQQLEKNAEATQIVALIDAYLHDKSVACGGNKDYWNEGGRWLIDIQSSHRKRYIMETLYDAVQRRAVQAQADGRETAHKNLIRAATHITNKVTPLANAYENKSICEHRGFADKMDCQPRLLAFNDGVVDLLDGCRFRPLEPDDYISMSTGYDYPTQDIPEIQQELHDFLSSIMPSEEMTEYLLTAHAAPLLKNIRERVIFMIGTGRNGKGVLALLYRLALGNTAVSPNATKGYYYTPPPGFLTIQKNANSSGPSDDKVQMKGCKILAESEPHCLGLNLPFIKQLVGGDEISARGLWAANATFSTAVHDHDEHEFHSPHA